jgi:exosome complex RNA-binding protein Rrp42 (RNase PH superfamily)
MTLDAETLKKLQPAEFYRQWMSTYFPVRPDGRDIKAFRPISIQAGRPNIERS